jgi:hypothetical protein
LFVTLNPPQPPSAHLTFGHWTLNHPQFDRNALAAQLQLRQIQGTHRTWYCGAWAGYGFHEDGLTSGLEIAEHLGAALPWGKAASPRIFQDSKIAAE